MKKYQVRTRAEGTIVLSHARAKELGLIGISSEAAAEIERLEAAHVRALHSLKTNPVLLR